MFAHPYIILNIHKILFFNDKDLTFDKYEHSTHSDLCPDPETAVVM